MHRKHKIELIRISLCALASKSIYHVSNKRNVCFQNGKTHMKILTETPHSIRHSYSF